MLGSGGASQSAATPARVELLLVTSHLICHTLSPGQVTLSTFPHLPDIWTSYTIIHPHSDFLKIFLADFPSRRPSMSLSWSLLRPMIGSWIKQRVCTKRYSLFMKQEMIIYKQLTLQVWYKSYTPHNNTNETYTCSAPSPWNTFCQCKQWMN